MLLLRGRGYLKHLANLHPFHTCNSPSSRPRTPHISQGHAITLLARLLADSSPPTVPISGRSHAVDSGPVTLCGPVALYLLQWPSGNQIVNRNRLRKELRLVLLLALYNLNQLHDLVWRYIIIDGIRVFRTRSSTIRLKWLNVLCV